MNQLVFIENGRALTDSLTIAETFGKEHKHVLRDIRELECSNEFAQSNFGQTPYVHPQNGQTYEKYLITQDGFAFLVMGYTGKEAARFKEMYINEFNRMRNELTKPQFALPQTLPEALRLLATEIEEKEQLKLEAQANAPKVALYDTAMNAKNNMTMMQVAKTLNIGRNKLFDFLREQKVLMKNNLPYQTYVERGYFDVRQYTITHFTTGLENKTQTLVTPKGMAWIHKLISEKGVTA